jgi:glycosyltransferase involved in cell wall biosynthesis
MDVSFNAAAENIAKIHKDFIDIQGYTHAAYQASRALARQGITCSVKDTSATIGISMGFPSDYSHAPGQYKVGYTAWESTHLKDGWLERMMSVDQLWATSSWTAEVFRKTTGREDIHVWPHGITSDWSPARRERGNVFTFLHVGEPQVRKNGQLTVEAFIDLFADNPDYQLIIKCSNINTTRVFMGKMIAGSPDSRHKNIRIITDNLPHTQMVEIFQKINALIYPTTGEGFGFIPLQALATGCPVATTTPWAEYEKFISVPIPSTLSPSEYPNIHPGDVFNVTKEDIKKSMMELVDNYEALKTQAYKNSFHIHTEYDWDYVTKPTVERIKSILS